MCGKMKAQPENKTASGNAPKTLEDLYKSDPIKACRKSLRLTVNVESSRRIAEIDRLLGNYGVEAIKGDWQNGYWCDVVATYSNTGDMYAPTVIQVRADYGSGSRFIVSSVGDFVERNSSRFGIV